jgi:hypothetical protein
MKIKLLAVALFTLASVSAQVNIGIRIGPPPAPRVLRMAPQSPGFGYVWVDGYYYPVNNRYRWHDGYWTRPPYPAARWVAPRYDSDRFYGGRWEGENGNWDHDHRSDRNRDRDYRKDEKRDEKRNERDEKRNEKRDEKRDEKGH